MISRHLHWRGLAAAPTPKRLITPGNANHDGLGGHFDALYEHLAALMPVFADLLPAWPGTTA